MKASAEISLYPLDADYESIVIDFIHELRKHKDLECKTNGMSTQLFGTYDVLMDVLKNEIHKTLKEHQCMVVLKLGKGSLKENNLPKSLK